MDGNAFQATFGSGVLNEMISPATPTGARTVSTVRCGMLAGIVRPYERRPSPATNSPISTAASVSPERQLERLARLGGDGVGELLATVAQGERDLADDVPALDGRALGPVGLCGTRGSDGTIDVSGFRSGQRRQRNDPSSGRSLSSQSPDAAASRLARDQVRDLVR